MTESKREKFVRIAEARTNKIIDMVQLPKKMSRISLEQSSVK